jgi:hypothetical protein
MSGHLHQVQKMRKRRFWLQNCAFGGQLFADTESMAAGCPR